MDKSLFHDGYKSWYNSFIQSSIQKFSSSESELQSNNMPEIISNKYESDINKELSLLRSQVHDNKLNTFSKIYSNFSLPKYLSFGLPKAKIKELSKVRVSAHELLIERGRYFRPKVPCEKRLCILYL